MLKGVILGTNPSASIVDVSHGIDPQDIVVRVPDCQGAYEALSERGAVFLTPPVRWDHGEVRAFFRDPDGHLFEISELVG